MSEERDELTLRGIFARVVDLESPEQQARVLDELCAGKDDLRRAVERLLGVTEQGLEALEASPRSLLDGLRGAGEAQLLRAGDRVENYVIEERIGRGGTAWVYRAHDARHDRKVAIKVAKSDQHERLSERERRSLAQLSHPSIARLIDSGRLESGSIYVVMDHVDGQELMTYIREHALGFEERIALFVRIVRAVQYLHARGLAHRDLKPSNILVRPDGQPVLLDFGLARLFDDEHSETVTAADERYLTAGYASPEQIEGKLAGLPSDVFSLGVLLYEVLTESLPFRRRRGPQWLRAVASGELLSLRDAREGHGCGSESGVEPVGVLRGLRADQLQDLEEVFRNMTRVAPQDRYSSLDGVSADLQRVLADRPVSVRGGNRLYVARRFARRNRVWLGVASVAAALIVILVWGGWSQYRIAEDRRRLLDRTERTLSDRDAAAAGNQSLAHSDALRTAEIYDPATGTFELIGPLKVPRLAASLIELRDGRIAVIGGRSRETWHVTAEAEVLNPDTGESEQIEPMTVPRAGAIFVPWNEGSWVVAGGTMEGGWSTSTAAVDLFTPEERPTQWKRLGRLQRPRADAAVFASAGRIVVVGGRYSCCHPEENEETRGTAEIFDPKTGRSELIEIPRSMRAARSFPLDDGAVLILPLAYGSWGGERGPNGLAHGLVFDGERFVPADSAAAERAVSRTPSQRRDAIRGAAGTSQIGVPFLDPWTGELLVQKTRRTPTGGASLVLRDGRYLAYTSQVGSEDVGDSQVELPPPAVTATWGVRDWIRTCPNCGPMDVARMLIHRDWSRGELAGSELVANLGAEPMDSAELESLPTEEWVIPGAVNAPAPGPPADHRESEFFEFLIGAEGVCGNADFGNSEPFLMILQPTDIVSSAYLGDGVKLRGRQEFYDRGDGTIAEIEGVVRGNVFEWDHVATVREGRSRAAFFHRTRWLPDGRIEGTLFRKYGVSPAAGIVWIETEPEAERRCRERRRQFDGERAAALDGGTRFASGGFEIGTAAVRGLAVEGDPKGFEERVPFLDLCAASFEPRGGGSCSMRVVRHSLGGSWRAQIDENCARVQRAFSGAYETWREEHEDFVSPSPTCSARTAGL